MRAMLNKVFDKTSSRVLFMLVQFFILLSCFIYLDYVYITNVRPDQLARQNFAETKCFIMTKKLATKGRVFHRYRAEFLVNYHANGVQYNRWVSVNGLDMSYTLNNASQEQALADYVDGKNYSCWYNPKNPEMVILVQRKIWSVITPLIVPALIGFAGLILFVINGWVVLRRARNKKNKF